MSLDDYVLYILSAVYGPLNASSPAFIWQSAVCQIST